MPDQILVIEDDPESRALLEDLLSAAGYEPLSASNTLEGLRVVHNSRPALVLLDIMLHGLDGWEACRRIRQASEVPFIIVSGRSSNTDILRGFELGADDYVTKPFSAGDVAARVRAVLRRTTLWDERPELAFCSRGLIVDFARHRVTVNNEEVNLTATEYRLLSYLARNADRVVTPDQILEKVWGEDYIGETHLLQVNITRLRQKLKDDAKNPKYILTKPGIGYMMLKGDSTR